MKNYVVIAGAVPAVHDRRVVKMGEILPESFFKDDEIAKLVKGQFIALSVEISETDEAAKAAVQDTGKKK